MQQIHAMQMNAAKMNATYTNCYQSLIKWGTKDPVIIPPTLKCEVILDKPKRAVILND